MDTLVSIALTLVAIFVVLNVITLVIMVSRLVRLSLQSPHTRIVSRDTLPVAHRMVLDSAVAELEAAGFKRATTRNSHPIILGGSETYAFCDCYYHPELDIHAEVFPATLPTKRWPFAVYLWNSFKDGGSLLTVNGLSYQLIPYPASVTVVDEYVPDFASQLNAHLKARQAFTAERYDAALTPRISMQMAERLLPTLAREGHLYVRGEREDGPVYGLRLRVAFQIAWRMRTGGVRLAKVEAAPAAGAPDLRPPERNADTNRAAEQIAFVGGLATLNGLHAPDWFRRLVFVISALLFLALGSYLWGALGALLIAAVIAFHEAGHWLAMRMSHFRDVQVFFVPGMGGATSGEKHEANPLTHLFVYLAGPIPGVVIGLIALAWLVFGGVPGDAEHFRLVALAAMALVLVNGFNLLPVTPLDGGRVVDLFVLGRLPWLRFVFASASALALLGLGIASGDAILRGLGIVLLIGLPHHFRMAKAERALRAAGLAGAGLNLGFRAAAERLHALLSAPQYASWNFQTKTSVGQALLPRLLGRFPGTRETVLALGIYTTALLLPIVALTGLIFAEPSQMLSVVAAGAMGGAATTPEEANASVARFEQQRAAERKAWDAKVDAAATAEEKWSLLMSRAKLDDESEDPELARLSAVRALELARFFPSPDIRFVESAALALGQEGDGFDRAALLEEAEAAARKLAPGDAPRHRLALADILDHRIGHLYTAENTHAARQLALAEEALSLRMAAGGGLNALSASRTQVAHAAIRANDVTRAEQMLKENFSQADLARADEAAAWRLGGASIAYAQFLIDHGRGEEALTLCTMSKLPAGAAGIQFSKCAAYLHLQAGRPAEAIKVVSQHLREHARQQSQQDFTQKLVSKALNLGALVPKSLLIIGREAALAAGDLSAQADMEEQLKAFNNPRARHLHCRDVYLPDIGNGRRMRQDIATWQARWQPCPAQPAK